MGLFAFGQLFRGFAYAKHLGEISGFVKFEEFHFDSKFLT